MGRLTDARQRPWLPGFMAGGIGLFAAVAIALLASVRHANADWPWHRKHATAACGHPGCHRNRCLAPEGWAGNWYWVRSPDQEQRVVMSHYNRYCIRCHGIDGRGVWDIPDVPDFTDPRWQASRSDAQIINILMEGRGAVMPTFRGTLALDEAAAMARYLRTFVPGSETPRPDVGRAAPVPPKPATTPASAEPIPPPRPFQANP
jgi:mono/diheme cytochrome c family protein